MIDKESTVDNAEPEDDSIQQDVLCRSCGYNLRGLSPKGRCPECGREIALSLRDDLLRYGNAGWLRKIRWGAWLFWSSHIFGLFIMLSAPVMFCTGIDRSIKHLGMMLFLATASSILVYVVSIFLITTSDPHQRADRYHGKARLWTRLLLVCLVSVSAIIVAPAFVRSLRSVGFFNITTNLSFALPVIFSVFLFTLGLFLGQFAQRSRVSSIGETAHSLNVLIVLVAVVATLTLVTAFIGVVVLPVVGLSVLVVGLVGMCVQMVTLAAQLKMLVEDETAAQKRLNEATPVPTDPEDHE